MIKLSDIEDRVLVYDIETDGVFPTYCNLKMVGYQIGLRGEPMLANLEKSTDRDLLQDLLRDPEMIKVSYNGINFDDIVLARFGFFVEPRNRHDLFLALKTINPNMPSFSLKIASWYYFGDWHEPQRRLETWLMRNGFKKKQIYKAPPEVLGPYCKHDVKQTVALFRMIWEIVQRPQHWDVYRKMELAMGEPLHEMIMFAGEWMNPRDIRKRIGKLEKEREEQIQEAIKISKGKIKNPASALQVSKYLHDEDQIELEISKSGNYSVRKADLVELMPSNPLAKAVYQIRDLGKVIQHYNSHLEAVEFEIKKRDDDPKELSRWLQEKGIETGPPDRWALDSESSLSKQVHKFNLNGDGLESVPKGYSLSGARTRCFQSSSQFGINFQNQNKRTKIIALVPRGWLGCWIDSRQIENVVHIWASEDEDRREAYELDPDWNEYVWLTNKILQSTFSRKELEEIPSVTNPSWSTYKLYKSIKLALNFFMGPAKFAKLTGISEAEAVEQFEEVHRACPAIRGIVRKLNQRMEESGMNYISDPFGHIYGQTNNSQMMVVHLVQGCGTGSVPKAMTVANYRTLHSLDTPEPHGQPCLWHPFKHTFSYGVICGTTHDECAFRISLGLPTKTIIKLIRKCLWNMEEKFSSLFDGIPLRAQLAVSITNASDQTELDHRKPDFEERLIREFIRPGKTQK